MGNHLWARLSFTELCVMFGCGLTLVIETATLVRVIRGSKHKFTLKILGMLFGANLAYLAEGALWAYMISTGFTTINLIIWSGFYATGMLLFNVGHWMFVHKYFSISRQAPFKLIHTEVPRRIVVCDQITNWVFLSLNSITAVLYAITYCII